MLIIMSKHEFNSFSVYFPQDFFKQYNTIFESDIKNGKMEKLFIITPNLKLRII